MMALVSEWRLIASVSCLALILQLFLKIYDDAGAVNSTGLHEV
jgi:hypothetical protein